jgi:hypothetical protein
MALMKIPTTQGERAKWGRIDMQDVFAGDGQLICIIEFGPDLTVIPHKKGDGRQPDRLALSGNRIDRPVITSRDHSMIMPMCYMLFGWFVTLMSHYVR